MSLHRPEQTQLKWDLLWVGDMWAQAFSAPSFIFGYGFAMADSNFHLVGTVYVQMNILNNIIRFLKILYKEFLESRGCSRTRVTALGSATGFAMDLG